MFRGSSTPQRKPFSLRREQIIEDIKAIKDKEEERSKLYLCLDEKPPQETRYSKIEEFLKGTNDLESISENLSDMIDDLERASKEIALRVRDLKEKSKIDIS